MNTSLSISTNYCFRQRHRSMFYKENHSLKQQRTQNWLIENRHELLFVHKIIARLLKCRLKIYPHLLRNEKKIEIRSLPIAQALSPNIEYLWNASLLVTADTLCGVPPVGLLLKGIDVSRSNTHKHRYFGWLCLCCSVRRRCHSRNKLYIVHNLWHFYMVFAPIFPVAAIIIIVGTCEAHKGLIVSNGSHRRLCDQRERSLTTATRRA